MARDWSTIRYFQAGEFQKDPEKIAWPVVELLDEMRHAAGVKIVIHVAWDDSGHEAGSAHYTRTTDFATAVDMRFVGWSLLDQWLFAERYPWRGIGIYPYWRFPGLHLDLRAHGQEHPNLGARWWRDAHGVYHPPNRQLLTVMMLLAPQEPR